MKMLIISDTHGKHRMLKDLPQADTIIHCGDISNMGGVREITDFIDWFDSLPYVNKIFIAGNHDFGFYNHTYSLDLNRYVRGTCIHYLENSGVTIDGIEFWGSPYTPKFYNWAFMKERGEPIKKVWQKIPWTTDVLITHGPPYDYGDLTYDGRAVGCVDLLEQIKIVRPTLNLFGHIHEGYGMYNSSDLDLQDTTFINASVLDKNYLLVNEPILINYYDFV